MQSKALFVHFHNQPRWLRIFNEISETCSSRGLILESMDATRYRFPSSSAPKVNAVQNPKHLFTEMDVDDFISDNDFSSEVISYFRTSNPKGPLAKWYVQKAKERARRFLGSLSHTLSREQYDTIYLPNGRLALSKIANKLALTYELEVLFVETNLPGFFSSELEQRYYVEKFPPHSRARVQEKLSSKIESGLEEQVFQTWLNPRMNPNSKSNQFSKSWENALEEFELEPRQSRSLNIFFTSSTDEFVALGDEWSDHGWKDQFEAIDRCLSVLKQMGETHFALRVHPNMISKSLGFFLDDRKRIEWLSNRHPDLEIFGPTSPQNTYVLLRKAKRVLVSVSTIGLEASGLGLPVWCTMPNNYDISADVVSIHNSESTTEETLKIPQVDKSRAQKHIAASLTHGERYVLADQVKTSVPLLDKLRAIGSRDLLFRLGHIITRKVQDFIIRLLLRNRTL